MTKRKDAAALFEVIARDRPMAAPPGSGAPGEAARGGRVEIPSPQQGAPAVLRRPVTGEAMFSTGGGRLRLSLNYVSCAVGGLGLALLLAMAFIAGRATATGTGPATNKPADTGLPGGHERAGLTGGVTTQPAGAKRIPGKYYLVIQGLQGMGESHRQEAFRIAEYCRQMGENCDVGLFHGREGSQYIVWSLKAFNSPSEPEALAHAQAIEKLGEVYFKKYKTYQPGKRGADGKYWFLPCRE